MSAHRLSGRDDAPSAAIAYHLCVEDIASRPSRENLCMEPDLDLAVSPACDFVFRSHRRFRHTVQRAAEHLSPATAPQALDDHIALGRQRRAQILQARQKHIDDKRGFVSELAAARADRVAAQLAAKLEAADLRRQANHTARHEQYAHAERLRQERMLHAREERVKRMTDYSDKVLPLLAEFRGVGLTLRGGATKTDEVQRILQQDRRAFCNHCNCTPNAHRCPHSGRAHPRHLVQVAEVFLCATSELRQWIHHDDRQRASDESSPAKATNPQDGEGTDEHLRSAGSNNALSGAVAAGVPQHLPLAFYHATEYSSAGDEAFLARNIVVLLDELYLAAKTLQAAQHGSDDPEDSVPDLGSHADHLRSVVSRFAQSWAKYVKAMRAREASATHRTASSVRQQLKAQTIRTYVHLAAAQSSRSSDEATGWTDPTSVSESDQSAQAGRSRRAALVREKQIDLTQAINAELNKLRHEIERMGGIGELEAKLTELGLLDSASSSCGVSSDRLRRNCETATDGDCEAAEVDRHTDPCSSATATPPPEPMVKSPRRRAPSGTKSSSKFRAQLAAERERLRRAKRAEQLDAGASATH